MDRNGTQVMMLGRVPDVQLSPQWRPEFVRGASSSDVPQNLLRPTLQSYPASALNGASRMVYDAAQQITLGRIGRFLGDTPPTAELAPPAGNGAGATAAAGGYGVPPAVYLLLTLSSAASAYHGYKRNKSVGWALWWALMGYMAPVVTPAIGIAQGWAKPAKR